MLYISLGTSRLFKKGAPDLSLMYTVSLQAELMDPLRVIFQWRQFVLEAGQGFHDPAVLHVLQILLFQEKETHFLQKNKSNAHDACSQVFQVCSQKINTNW